MTTEMSIHVYDRIEKANTANITPAIVQRFKDAVTRGDQVTVKQLTNKFGSLITEFKCFSLGNTALCYSASYGRMRIVECLLDAGADVNSTDDDNQSALIYASMCGCSDIVELLISRGAHVDAVDSLGMTALHWACYCKKHNVISILMSHGADYAIRDNRNRTALDWALLLEDNETINSMRDAISQQEALKSFMDQLSNSLVQDHLRKLIHNTMLTQTKQQNQEIQEMQHQIKALGDAQTEQTKHIELLQNEIIERKETETEMMDRIQNLEESLVEERKSKARLKEEFVSLKESVSAQNNKQAGLEIQLQQQDQLVEEQRREMRRVAQEMREIEQVKRRMMTLDWITHAHPEQGTEPERENSGRAHSEEQTDRETISDTDSSNNTKNNDVHNPTTPSQSQLDFTRPRSKILNTKTRRVVSTVDSVSDSSGSVQKQDKTDENKNVTNDLEIPSYLRDIEPGSKISVSRKSRGADGVTSDTDSSQPRERETEAEPEDIGHGLNEVPEDNNSQMLTAVQVDSGSEESSG